MAELQICENGHYFDPDMYPNGCPYCSGESRGVDFDSTAPVSNIFMGTPNQYLGMETVPLDPPTIADQSSSSSSLESNTVPVNLLYKKSTSTGVGDSDVIDDSNFVVGWLVAVEGPYRGKSFEVHNGYTDIGRTKGDIILSLDGKVSACKNVSIVYDADNNCFYVSAGASRNLVHVNGEALISGGSKELKAYYSIKIGETKLLFVPFCSEKFSWTNEE